jgi:hypothetical protein
MKMKEEDREIMRRERQQYNDQKRSKSEIKELRAKIQELGETVSDAPLDSNSVSGRT